LEVIRMHASVALRARAKLALLLNSLLHAACQGNDQEQIDPRNLRTFRQLLLALLAKRSTRLLMLAQAILPQRRATSVKAVAMGLGYFLAKAKLPIRPFATALLEAALRRLALERLAWYRGKVLLVIDPTDYAKRSRGRGKRGRQMQYIGRVRKSKAKATSKRKGKCAKVPTLRAANGKASKGAAEVATTFGYVDVWAGLVLRAKQFLPLVRCLCSSNHPQIKSQNQVEAAVLAEVLGLLQRVGLVAIVVGDRGLGRKELIIDLVRQGQDLVLRIDADILVRAAGIDGEAPLEAVLGGQPWLGEVAWDRGKEGKLRCRARAVRGTIRFSRSGRKADYVEATLNFLQLVPIAGGEEPLVVATTLPVATLTDAKGVAGVYAQRWAVETAFETMHAWGQERFMVRSWEAIDRLLWMVALAYALVALALQDGKLVAFRKQAIAVLRRLSVLGRSLTVGKLAEAIGLDFGNHKAAWASVWLG
jgi:hypothetical protein